MFDEIDKPKQILQLSHINFFAKNSEDWAEPAPTSPLNINQQFVDSSSLGDEFEVAANVSGSRGYGTRFVWNSVMSTLLGSSRLFPTRTTQKKYAYTRKSIWDYAFFHQKMYLLGCAVFRCVYECVSV